MPVLPIADEEGQLYPFARHILFGINAYPMDGERLEEFIASSLASVCSDDPEGMQLLATAPWFLSALHRAPEPNKVELKAVKRGVSAWPCGEILLCLLSAASHHGREIEVTSTKVIWAMEHLYRGQRLAASTKTLEDAWRMFRPVAHLHAASRAWMYRYGEDRMESYVDWAFSEEYLALSEAIRKQAEMRRFLSPLTTWRTPDSLVLPPITFVPGPLKPEMISLLKAYKPKHSRH